MSPKTIGIPQECVYPESNPTRGTIWDELNGVAANKEKCSSFYLATGEGMSNDILEDEGDDHHQGLARTHRLSDGSVYFFLSHAEMDEGDQGNLAQFCYSGPLDDEHILPTTPLTVAPRKQLLRIEERHPADITFLPDVNHMDAGYLFVTESVDKHRLSIYRWEPNKDLVLQGRILQGFPEGTPNFVFVDKVDNYYYLGIAGTDYPKGVGNIRGWGKLFRAKCSDLFSKCQEGGMDVSAFMPATPESMFPFPVIGEACQVKLIKDSTGQWFLLGFRSEDPSEPKSKDYVDVYQVQFSPYFAISYRLSKIHISFRPGETGFASTGTHYVESSGRLLISSSYRWSREEGPGDSSYVSRVDECPSW